MRNNLLLMTVALVAGAVWASPVEWEFPRTRNCHEGIPFSDGVTGVLVWGNDIMQMDGQCAATTAVMELLVHEVNGKVEYFRGCPESWKDVSFENIRLSDGTSVSGSRVNGVVKITTIPNS